MKNIWSGLFVAGVLAASTTVAAQVGSPVATPPADNNERPGTQRTTPAPAAQAEVKNTVTVSGCLQNAPAAATASGRGSPDAAAAGGFVLANPQMTASGAAADRGVVGTTGSDVETTYRLDGDAKMLSPHVNHQVRITGTLQSSAASATGAARSAPGSTAAGATLKVESVEMVDATCASASPSPSVATPRAEPAQPAQPAQPARPGRGGQPAQPATPAVPPGK